MSPILIILMFGQQKCQTNPPSLFECLTGKLHHRVLFMYLFELQVYGNLLIILGMHNQCISGCFSHVRLSAHTLSSSLAVFLKEVVCICVETGCFALFSINYFNFYTSCERKRTPFLRSLLIGMLNTHAPSHVGMCAYICYLFSCL